ncbi:NUDIX domain-containing protein [Tepidamorphus gemmatus]|uniref:NUDIX domain-containing protein n=1 Tax=Tepidamorphus gemmatus TaxID=747076 RepID=UPI001FE0DE60|nr:NUDIX domain-containing protein [Tepidamorphus gemmatus]
MLTHLVFRPWWRLSRGMTLGVRGIVIRDPQQVLLVRHSYVPGWYLPGGGVERGETVFDALGRELDEEGGVQLTGVPQLHGIFCNDAEHRGDHVVAFLVRDWSQARTVSANLEIVAAEFFPADALPDGTTPATRRRVAEVFQGAATSPYW